MANRPPGTERPAATIHQFEITLEYTVPRIWRCIEIGSDATFWDLHCAINDAMGWEDAHLHAFEVGNRRHPVTIGMSTDGLSGGMTEELVDWEVAIADHFRRRGNQCTYVYDFGDSWHHTVRLQRIGPREPGVTYPRCTDGARACPPEDCGGIYGYARICEVLSSPEQIDDEGEELLEWLGDDFDPAHFDPAEVAFRHAALRLADLFDNT